MTDLQNSQSWYKVSDLKPNIRNHITVKRQEYRQQTWYIFTDKSNGKHHRFNQLSYQLIGLINGKNSLQTIWEIMQERYDDKAPTKNDIIKLIGQLYASDIIQCKISPDNVELFERYQKHKSSHWKNALKNPLSLRFTIFDPNNFLDHLLPISKLIFTKSSFILWLAIMFAAIVLAAGHWSGLSENISDRVLTTNNLLLIALLYPIIKIIHELGHALATKVWGGEVHEIGIMFLALIPNPYVNTSSAWSFDQKHQRIIVSAAGMMFELLVASFALFFWLAVEPGLARAVAFNIMIISSVTTLIFNLNPLLKFDGYYILSDLINIPNLTQRSNKYISYLIQRYLFGLKNTPSQVTSKGESNWFLFYGITAFFYRIFILAVITIFIASKFFIVGILLATWIFITQIIAPISKQVNYLFRSPSLGNKRQRAITVSTSIICSLIILIFFVPVPTTTIAQGIIRLPEKSEIRIESTGFVKQVLVTDGAFVEVGTPLIESFDPLLLANEKIILAKLKELDLKIASLKKHDRLKSEITKDKYISVKAKLDRILDQKNKLIVLSKNKGVFIRIDRQDITNRFLQKGEVIGYVINSSKMTARIIIPQNDMDKIKSVEVKLANKISETIHAKIIRESPIISSRLPSAALGTQGGGPFVTDPQDPDGLQTLSPILEVDVELESMTSEIDKYIGGRIYAKFNHEKKPMAQHWYRSLRQLFLSQFDV